jgi:peptidyl-prolyl cis-trans isomerase D
MISSFRNFAKTKFAGLLVFIMIIPFVFWGMGSMFSSGNTNNLAKINNKNISTQEFIDYLNNSGIPQETIRNNLNNNIIEELLSSLVSSAILNLEIKNFNLIISEKILLKKIKNNKNFIDENGNFQRTKYEKFLLENNQSAPQFEQRLKNRDLQKNLFDFVGAGTVSPKFLVNKLYEEENTKLDIEFIDLKSFYKKKDSIKNRDLNDFVNNNKDQLTVEYIDFEYSIINPKKLIGTDEFNQSFFDKIDQIDINISNNVDFKKIISDLNIESTNVTNFKFSSKANEIEKKIFELRKNKIDIFEIKNDYIIYNISNISQKKPDLTDEQTKNEIIELVFKKNKFDYNKELLEKIRNNAFNEVDFLKMGQDKIETVKLNSIKDNNKFDINAVEILYSLPVNSFTLINDEKSNIYLAKVTKYHNKTININEDNSKEYIMKQSSNNKNTLLKSYDLFLSNKYDVTLNQKTIERVKNFFK